MALEMAEDRNNLARSPDACMRVVVFAPSFPPAFLAGGPARTLDALVSAGAVDHDIAVLAPDHDLGESEKLPVVANRWIRRDGADVRYVSSSNLGQLIAGFFAVRRLCPGLLYLNSFFNSTFSILPLLLWRIGFWHRPVRLMAPRGEMGTAALRQKSFKKRSYILFFRMLRMHRGMIWHASSFAEAEDIRNLWGPNAEILIREDETKLAKVATPPVEPPPGSAIRIVYLARIVEHKGLAIALDALVSCSGKVTLEIFGNEEDGEYAASCRDRAALLPSNVRVTFRGPIRPEEVLPMLVQKDVMILPTAGENFAHSIAEALSCSCVVVASRETPWTSTLLEGGGFVPAERTVTAWAETLADVTNMTPDALLSARLRAMHAYNVWKGKAPEAHVFDMVRASSSWTIS